MLQRQHKNNTQLSYIQAIRNWLHTHLLELCIVSVLLVIAAYLRWLKFDQYLFFGFEQGRDFLVAEGIVTAHDFVLVGPKTDIGGIFHGAYYYYLLAGLLLLTKNPLTIAVLLSFFSLATIVVVYMTLKTLSKSLLLASIGAALVALSYHYIQYARWLSNVSPAVFFGALAFYGIQRYQHTKRDIFFILFVGSFFLAAQFQIILSLWGVFFVAMILLLRLVPRPRFSTLIISVSIIAALYAPQLIFNLRNDWITLHSVREYINSSEQSTPVISDTFRKYVLIQLELLQKHIIGIPQYALVMTYAGMIGVVVYKRKELNKVLIRSLMLSCVWCIMTLPALLFPHSLGLVQLYVLSGIGLCIGTAILLYLLATLHWGKVVYIAVFVLVVGNAINSTQKLLNHSDVFFTTIQTGHIYRDQQAVLAYIGRQTAGAPHHFAAFTIPYYQDEGWRYLHAYYLGSQRTIESDTVYLVIEKPVDPHWRTVWTGELGPTELVETVGFNYFTLEVRKKIAAPEHE